MLKQLQHKQFAMRNERLSLPGCYWYVQATGSIVPIGNENDSKYKRPRYVHKEVYRVLTRGSPVAKNDRAFLFN